MDAYLLYNLNYILDKDSRKIGILNIISHIFEIEQCYLLLCKNQLKIISDNPNVMVKETVRDTMKGAKTS